MPTNYKTPAQANPAANTPTDLYTVPGATQTIISGLVISNTGSTAAAVTVWLRSAGAAAATRQIVVPATTVLGNDAITVLQAQPLGAADVVTVQASTANVAFNLGYSEITP